MALHDYQCPDCGVIVRDYDVPIAVGAQAGAPNCPMGCVAASAGAAFFVKTVWIPQVGRMDAYEPFQEFTVVDGQGKTVLVESLRQLRQIEDQSEQQARNGEGQPMVWRDYSQDASNFDQHTLAKDTSKAIDQQEDVLVETRESQTARFAGTDVRIEKGEAIPFSRDRKTSRGVPMAKETGSAVTGKHGTV